MLGLSFFGLRVGSRVSGFRLGAWGFRAFRVF